MPPSFAEEWWTTEPQLHRWDDVPMSTKVRTHDTATSRLTTGNGTPVRGFRPGSEPGSIRQFST